ncbi:MAG: SLC13 family permease [Caldilineaceae bacterium]|nr:SLC13 family permease [Caldilineaceae bacterium]
MILTPEMALLLSLMGIALVLFTFEWVAADVVALGFLVIMILTGLLSPSDAFAGFGSDTVFTLMGLFMLTAALQRTGVVEMTGRTLLRYTGDNPNRLVAMIMVATSSLSSFMSNTACTAFFLPITLGLAERMRVSAGKLLMPLAFASILASSVTLVATSTNIVINGLLRRYEMTPMGMFELTPVGIPIAVVGILYMLFIGRRLLPDRSTPDDLGQLGNRLYLTELVVLPTSPLIGKTLAESALGQELDLTVVRVVRKENRSLPTANRRLEPRTGRRLRAGDILLVEGARESLLRSNAAVGLELRGNQQRNALKAGAEELPMVEVILMPNSPLIGVTLAQYRFRERYGLQVLAVYRHGETLQRKISQMPLRVGDVLLIQSGEHNVAALTALEDEQLFHVLGAVQQEHYQRERAPFAIAAFVGALGLAATEIVALPVAVLIGTLAIFLTRCISVEEAYRKVEWRALVLIGSMLALGTAMEQTGTAAYLAEKIVMLAGSTNPLLLLTGFFALAVILTQPMSNQAAAIVVVPIAIQTASQLGLNPRTFVMMIAIAASTSYLTPLEPSCLMVYGPGNYRFSDFLKVGSLLTLVVYGIAILLVPIVWPL